MQTRESRLISRRQHHRVRYLFVVSLWFLAFLPLAGRAIAQTTSFTYQGKLSDSGTPVNGSYDFVFTLWDAATNGTQIGSLVSLQNTQVVNGIFTVQLDFGAPAFNGATRYLEITVKPSGNPAILPTLLTPRQLITSTPYAIKSLGAVSADSLSVSCVNCITSSQIAGLDGSKITGTIPVASIPAGSSNYIQNTTSQQASSNFNISGTGKADTLDVTTQYNLGGFRILSNAGSNNLFAGINAGINTTGGNNAFFGKNSGQQNTTGFSNSFFGVFAGQANTTGFSNSFFGSNAGLSNTTGKSNAFFGSQSGVVNTTGNFNAFFGFGAGSGNTTGSENSFFGNNAGDLNTTGNSNAFFGSQAGQANTTGSLNAFFGANAGKSNTIASNNSFFGNNAGFANTSGNNNAFFGSQAGQANTSGNGNSFFGNNAGQANTTGVGNAFFGDSAGAANTIGNSNAFFGSLAGQANTTGILNSFFGAGAGNSNTTGIANSFFGRSAGLANTTGNNNSFFGLSAGSNNSTGFNNAFFGREAGLNNNGNSNAFFGFTAGFSNTTGSDNSFFGAGAGKSITTGNSNSFFGKDAGRDNDGVENTFLGMQAGATSTGGSSNVFVGVSAGGGNISGNKNAFFGTTAGITNDTGSGNTIIGGEANVIVGNLNNATAVGFRAAVGQSNALVLGSINGVNGAFADTKVGIGTTTPQAKLHVNGIIRADTLGSAGATSLCRNANNEISTCSSSLRYKTEVQTFTGGLNIINRLRPITFTWKAGGMRDVGFGAEEVAQVEPLLTFRNPKGEVEGVKYAQISAVLVNAVKEQQAQIASQQQQITDLKRQLREMAMLKKLVCTDHPQAEICNMQ